MLRVRRLQLFGTIKMAEKQRNITRVEDITQFTRAESWECDFDLEGVLHFINEEQEELGLNMDPDFQRDHVWTENQQSRWIEFPTGQQDGPSALLQTPRLATQLPGRVRDRRWQAAVRGQYAGSSATDQGVRIIPT